MHCGCIEGALEDAFVRALPGAFADALQVHSNVYFMCIICALDVHLQVHCRCQIELVKSCAGLETERLFSLVDYTQCPLVDFKGERMRQQRNRP